METIEKLARVLQRIVASLERYSNYEILFKNNLNTQKAIGALYSDLIDLCTRVVKFHSRSALSTSILNYDIRSLAYHIYLQLVYLCLSTKNSSKYQTILLIIVLRSIGRPTLLTLRRPKKRGELKLRSVQVSFPYFPRGSTEGLTLFCFLRPNAAWCSEMVVSCECSG